MRTISNFFGLILGPILRECIGDLYFDEDEDPDIVMKSLALILDCGHSKRDYKKTEKAANKKSKGKKNRVFSKYHEIEKAKKDCRPFGIVATNDDVQVSLQNMSDHTATRILEDEQIARRIFQLAEENGGTLKVHCNVKLGIDGSNGLQTINILVDDDEEDDRHESQMVATNFVAINMWAIVNGKIKVVYHNSLHNSSYGVRPLRHWYRKENDVLEDEIARIREEMKNLTELEWADGISIKYVPFFTMNDQKVMNAIFGNTDPHKCPICKAGRAQFKDIKSVYKANPEALAQLCYSSLHFGPRVMENLLKVGFYQDFQKYPCTGAENKELRAKRKKVIQKILKKKLGVPVFEVRRNGGTSNTGNVARKLFKNSLVFSEAIGVCDDLVYRLFIIWITITSGLPICPDKFDKYCKITKDLYHEECGWYPMVPTLHKVLEHGGDILRLFPPELTAGMMSEEPAEASNKDVKEFQRNHSFQGNYKQKNLDVFHRMCDRSDPVVHRYFVKEKVDARAKNDNIPQDVLELCINSEDLLKRMEVNKYSFEPESTAKQPISSFFSNL